MSKIWIIRGRGRYNKPIIVNKEPDILNKIYNGMDSIIEEYELISKVKVDDFLKAIERDAQLKGILGELDKKQVDIQEFISLFDKIAFEDKRINRFGKIIPEKTIILKNLKKLQLEPVKFKNYLKKKIEYFSKVSLEQEWFIAILKVHNFRSINYGEKWRNGKYMKITPPPEIQKAFEDAKKAMSNKNNKK